MRQSLIPAGNPSTNQKVREREQRRRSEFTTTEHLSYDLRRGALAVEDLSPAQRQDVQLLWIEEYINRQQRKRA